MRDLRNIDKEDAQSCLMKEAIHQIVIIHIRDSDQINRFPGNLNWRVLSWDNTCSTHLYFSSHFLYSFSISDLTDLGPAQRTTVISLQYLILYICPFSDALHAETMHTVDARKSILLHADCTLLWSPTALFLTFDFFTHLNI